MVDKPGPDAPLVQVSAGRDHSCGLDKDGRIHCWGRDYHGSTFSPEGSFVQVSASDSGAVCAVEEDGSVLCWGGFVGGVKRDAVFRWPGAFSQVTVGSDWFCALDVSAVAICGG